MHFVTSNPRRPLHLVASQSLSNGEYFLAWKDDYIGLMGIQNLGQPCHFIFVILPPRRSGFHVSIKLAEARKG